MTVEKVDFQEASKASAVTRDQSKEFREMSSIDFPYMALDFAIEVAKAIYSRCGFGTCDQDELAAQMGQTLSGAFRQKTSAARSFGLVAKDGRSAFLLTDLGKRIVSPENEKSAKVEAFLAVPLYNQIFDKFRGHNLPPAKALEREMETLGVSGKVTDRARQAFEKSAQLAGFFDSGKERLVRPRMEGASQPGVVEPAKTLPLSQEVKPPTIFAGGGSSSPLREIDPIIQGLINKLPPSGAVWAANKRKLWLQILANSLDLVYEDSSTDTGPD
ncbi:hypothetical protein [Aestuariivirga sp.]|uniref:hypothetical protein n=1 Tax=Aestuariivirga sp. TaxID=2650926 RepID=UPI0039E2215D